MSVASEFSYHHNIKADTEQTPKRAEFLTPRLAPKNFFFNPPQLYQVFLLFESVNYLITDPKILKKNPAPSYFLFLSPPRPAKIDPLPDSSSRFGL
jgi:hypothetical protein